VPVGAFVSDKAASQFDVYTIIPGGASAVQPSSLTIVQDVPAANRGIASGVTANATNGLITYVQSAAPTGTFALTFGWCDTGTATYSASNPNCQTGQITYAPGVESNMGSSVTVSIATSNVYQKVSTAVIGPNEIASGQTVTAYSAAGAAAIPRLQATGTILGDATVNNGKLFTAIVPIPAGASFVGADLMGGDALTASTAVVTYCPTFTSPGCKASTGPNFVGTTAPYVQVSLPDSVTVPGGGSVTMPTIAVTLQATGAAGTTLKFSLTEFQTRLNISAAIIGTTDIDFKGYPTSGNNTAVTPPLAPPAVLKSVLIT
jgi:hypothetical protein